MGRLLRGCWYATAAVAVAAAVAVSMARLLLPLAERYRPELEVWASRGVGMPVRIGRVEGGWRGLHPQLTLEGVRVLDPGRGTPWLEVRRVRVALDLWRSLTAGQAVAARVEAEGTALAVARDADGRMRVLGMRARERRGPAGAVLGRILAAARGGIVLDEVRLVYHQEGLAPVLLDRARLRLVVRGGAVELAAATELPEALGRRLRLAARLPLERAAAGSPDGLYYLAVEDLRLGHPLVRGALPGGVRLAGLARATLWARVEGGRLARLAGRAELAGFELALGERPPLAAARAWGRFDWRRLADGWRLAVADFQRLAGAGGAAAPPAELALEVRRGADDVVARVRAAARTLRAEDAAAVAAAVLPAEGRELLARAAPRGLLRRLALVAHAGAGGWRLALAAEGQDLAVAPDGRRPGFEGLDLRLEASERAARVALAARDVTLHLPRVFRWPLAARRLDGELHARLDADRWRVELPRLRVENDDLAGEVAGVVTGGVPARRANVSVDLAARFRARDAGRTSRYLPVAVIPPPVVAWLDHAVRGGRAPEGAMILRGPMARFPFRGTEGRFLVRFALEDAALEYARGWPRLEGAAGEVTFSQARLDATVLRGRVLGAEVSDLRIAIAELGRHAVLELEGRAAGSVGDGIAFLRATGLAGAGYTRWLRRVEGEGPLGLGLSLRLPLGRIARARLRREYRGTVRVRGAVLRDLDRGVALTRVHGRVAFSPAGLASERLEGRLLGRPVRLRLRPAGGATRLEAQARLPVAVLGRLAGRTPPRFVSGGAAWALEALLPRGGAPAELVLRSDLRGVTVALPAPLGKAAGEAVPSWLALTLRGGAVESARFRYGARLAGHVRDPEGRPAGELRLGGDVPARPPVSPGLLLAGGTAFLDLDGWRALLGAPARVAPGDGGTPAAALRRVLVEARRVRFLGREWPSVELAGRREPDTGAWSVVVRSPRVEGAVRLPGRGGGPVRARLARLRLAPQPEAREEARRGQGEALSPRGVPALDVVIDDFRYGGRVLGRWRVVTEPAAEGLAIRRLEVTADVFTLRGSGVWVERGGRQTTRFEGTIESDDVGAALARLGYARGLEARHLRADIDGRWTGPPWRPALERLDGRLHLVIRKGRLLEVDPGAGRLFGLLSLTALPRRLSLDFSDLFGRGLAFDVIEGDFLLEEGDAYTNNLILEGPTARIEIAGRIGLARRDYDQRVRVTPHLSGGLPLAGALLGGPAVGAAILLFQKAVRDPLAGVARYEYRLRGSWEKPVLERTGGEDGENEG